MISDGKSQRIREGDVTWDINSQQHFWKERLIVSRFEVLVIGRAVMLSD